MQNVDRQPLRAPEEWRSLAPIGASSYEISSHGRIRSLITRDTQGEPLVMRLALSKGYLNTRLMCDDSRPRTVFVHRALCRVWHGPRPSRNHVAAHRRDVKTWNTPDEVQWTTRSVNAKAAIANGAHIVRRGRARGRAGDLAAATVRAVRARVDNGETVAAVARSLGLDYRVAYGVATRLTYQHVKPTLAQSERARLEAEAELGRQRATRKAEHDALMIESLERVAPPAGQRRRLAPHTPAARAPMSTRLR